MWRKSSLILSTLALLVLAANCRAGSGITVSSQEYGDKWPYTIPEGVLECQTRIVVGYVKNDVTIRYNGRIYAINGSARGNHNFAPLEQIWRDNPEHPGSKIPDPGIIKRGLQLCE